ncbi:hypothetical protein DENSPDRAFT_847114 [Dentipellis sp. KUC8613]|nr:hypothetical protein DENSPDRAFT_847114 [Dentipellis sp. KUC8613]
MAPLKLKFTEPSERAERARKYCTHCDRWVNPSTELAHRLRSLAPLLQGTGAKIVQRIRKRKKKRNVDEAKPGVLPGTTVAASSEAMDMDVDPRSEVQLYIPSTPEIGPQAMSNTCRLMLPSLLRPKAQCRICEKLNQGLFETNMKWSDNPP